MDVFFKSWDSIIRVFLTVLFLYPGLIFLLRITGKRSLSKLNIFDFVITIALGSTLASGIISQNVTIADGIFTLGMLLVAQFAISWLSVHWWPFNKIIKSEPTLLFYDGHFLDEEMQRMRVVKEEILAEIRQQGLADLDDVYAVVLETNGMLSVIQSIEHVNRSTLTSVKNYTPPSERAVEMQV